jgi:hypothetical protein
LFVCYCLQDLLNSLKISDKLHRRKILANIRYYGPDTQRGEPTTPRAVAAVNSAASSPLPSPSSDIPAAAAATNGAAPSSNPLAEVTATTNAVVIPVAAVVVTPAVAAAPSSSPPSVSTVPQAQPSPLLAPSIAPALADKPPSGQRVSFNLPPSTSSSDKGSNGNRSSDADQREPPRVRVSIAHSPNASPRLGLPGVPETPLHAQSIAIPVTPAGSGGIVGPGAANAPSDQKVGSNYRVLSKEEVGALQTPKNATFAFRIGEVVACLVSHAWLEDVRMKSPLKEPSDFIESEFEAPTVCSLSSFVCGFALCSYN